MSLSLSSHGPARQVRVQLPRQRHFHDQDGYGRQRGRQVSDVRSLASALNPLNFSHQVSRHQGARLGLRGIQAEDHQALTKQSTMNNSTRMPLFFQS